jgi:hypothetical protein
MTRLRRDGLFLIPAGSGYFEHLENGNPGAQQNLADDWIRLAISGDPPLDCRAIRRI